MSEFEKQEALWDTENGMENRKDEHTEVPVKAAPEEVAEEDFEIPDIPAEFPAPAPTVPAENVEKQAQVQEQPQPQPVQEPRVWNSRTAKQQVKDAKKKYRLEKKRLRREKHMRSPGWRKILATGLLCAFVGGLVGALITITALGVSNRIFHIDLLDLRPEQIEVIREQYVAQIQEYKSPGTAVYKKNCNSVVFIRTSGETKDSVWETQSIENCMASGVVYQADGYILTNVSAIRHVLQADGTLQENASIEVYLPQRKETVYPARVVGYDWETDVAVLQIDETALYPVEFGDSVQVQQGETVFTMGYPAEPDALYIKESMVSHFESDFFAVDSRAEQEWKAGPLFSAEGQFIGLNRTNDDVTLVVPSNQIVQACNRIIEG